MSARSDVDELVATGATFDVVVLWHVAEHLGETRRCHAEASAGCSDRAAFCWSPSPTSRPRRPGWAAPVGSTSTCRVISCTSLPRRSPRCCGGGIRPAKVTYLVPEYDLFSFVQTMENRLGLPPNLLYDVLRRSEARLRRQRRCHVMRQSPSPSPGRCAGGCRQRGHRLRLRCGAARRSLSTPFEVPISASNGGSADRAGAARIG